VAKNMLDGMAEQLRGTAMDEGMKIAREVNKR
jgi:hypothetical protein